MRWLRRFAIVCAALLPGCAWYPVARIPEGKEGALVIRCHQVHGWFRRDSRWMVIVWVWSKSGTLPENPGELEVDGTCDWRVVREVTDH